MRKVFVLLLLLSCLIIGNAKAEGLFKPELNFAGDTIFVFGETAFASGVGIQVGKFAGGLFELKGQYVFAHKDGVSDKAGIGLGLNVVEGLRRIGVTDIPDWLNASCGLLALVDVNKDEPRLSAGLYVTIIKIGF